MYAATHGPQRRVLLVTESFLPQVNGVTNSVCRVLDHLADRGHVAQVVAPTGPSSYGPAEVRRVRGVALPAYRDFRLGIATRRELTAVIEDFRPDVVHLASPALLGRQAAVASRALDVPVVAVFQTDLVGFARRYRLRVAERAVAATTGHVHGLVDRTLVPSRASLHQLTAIGVPDLHLWPRGVDLARFHPARRSLARHALLAGGDVLVGYVGRLAAEKQLHLLRGLRGLPGVRVVVVGGGPLERRLGRQLPGVTFLGEQRGDELATLVASLDLFVHTGTHETYCQAAQEALAAGVPVVAPDSGGLRDLVRHGENGLLYAPGDELALRHAVAELGPDHARRRSMATAARSSVQHRSWAAVGDQLLDHYAAVLGERPGVGEVA